MASASQVKTRDRSAPATSAPQPVAAQIAPSDPVEKDKVLPLPRWLTRVYFIFPIVLYVPDAIFNFYVYTDGVSTRETNPLLQVGFFVLWAFVSLGVVGMAYLLSVLAPWHWGQGHRLKAFFASLGVIVATGITTWNSLAYRSTSFVQFKTDDWIWTLWPQLKAHGISITMILVAIAPPFWGLFWAIVQPTETGRSLKQIEESHAEKLLRTQQEAELKALKAEANAKVRAAQLRGMAATAAAARDQAKGIFGHKEGMDMESESQSPEAGSQTNETLAELAAPGASSPDDSGDAHKVLQYPREQVAANGRGGMVMYNHAASATPTVHSAPMGGKAVPGVAQPSLTFGADVQGSAGMPASDAVTFTATPRRAATFFGAELQMSDAEAMSGASGPQRALHKANELGTLNRTMNEPVPPQVAELIRATMRDLSPQGGKKSISSKVLVPAVAERLNVDNTTAQRLVARFMKAEQQRAGRVSD